MSEKYCVYDESIVPGLKEAVAGTQEAIRQAQALYPGCEVGAMFWTLAHRVATLATNAALGYPLDRMYSDSKEAEVLHRGYVPEGTAAGALKNQGRIVRNSIIEECAKVCVSAFASSNASERDDIWLEAASAIRALKHSLISPEITK